MWGMWRTNRMHFLVTQGFIAARVRRGDVIFVYHICKHELEKFYNKWCFSPTVDGCRGIMKDFPESDIPRISGAAA